MGWRKQRECKWIIRYNGFIYEYDTARELGRMVKESGSKMPNPYDPCCTDYDDFNDEIWMQQNRPQ